MSDLNEITKLLGEKQSEYLLNFKNPKISKDLLFKPHPDWVYRAFADSDRNPRVLGNLQRLYGTGRLKNTGYLSILPVDQGIEHSGGASFAKNRVFFDSEAIVELAHEAGCNAVCSTFGVLGSVARKWAHKIPFMVKINHNQLLSYPNQFDEVLFGNVKQAYDMGAAAIGATIYFGSAESNRQIQEVSKAFALAHEFGLATVLWCYLRNPEFNDKTGKKDYHVSADLTGQANHLGVTIQADIIKQKLPENNGGYLYVQSKDKSFGKTDKRVYSELTEGEHPIDLARYQVANCYLGRIGLINSGGPSGDNDFAEAVKTAVVNKRAGGQGLISGRKAFQRLPADGEISRSKVIAEGVKLLNVIQDVYREKEIGSA
ncbi:MAG: class I fructose-bisphosphate aldolase [Puniceicoccales bacterium]|jgi:class I fructose-bisphosphate aldolase|nr:class I fructose-bisphosphate aldolase [Puniceicoccales bacterium]